ncbi:hypothetical protein C8F01DRAFT_1260202 [Mycena amicta]|nr:hypothetical protein C8F01DRAFT_1260202 [Mycena amicta]
MSATSDSVNIVVDDTVLFDQPNTVLGDPNGGQDWTFKPGDFGFPSRFNDTAFIIQSNFGKDGWFFSFDGTSVSLYGITPPLPFDQTIAFAAFPFDTQSDLSGSNPATYNITRYPQAAFGGLLYSTPTLPNGASAIEVGLTGASGILLDYAVVSVGDLTDLRGQTIIVDDVSPEIFWNGTWTERSNLSVNVFCVMPFDTQFNETGSTPFTASMRPHDNTTHQSSTPGDAFVFQFRGSSLLVSGVTPSSDTTGGDWLLSMSFTLYTNNSSDTPITTTTNMTRDVTDSTRPHFTYFSAPLLEPGDHTLVARILAVAGTPVPQAQIDYITYLPSFATVKDKPKFNPAAAAATLGSATADTTSSVSGSATQSGVPSSSSSGGSGQSSNNKVAAIAGGVVGGLGFLILALLGIFWFLRRRAMTRRKASDRSEDGYTNRNPTFVRPFTNYTGSSQNGGLQTSYSSSAPLVYEPYAQPATATAAANASESIRTTQTMASHEVANNLELQVHMRELQTQVVALTQQLRHQEPPAASSPPSYRGDALSSTDHDGALAYEGSPARERGPMQLRSG